MKENHTTVIIVGAGLVGIAAAYYLSRHNIPYIILEKSNNVGGIWTSLRWPGIRCDTEIINYSYSFRPYTSNEYLVPGNEISAYLNETAEELGIRENICFDTQVKNADFSRKDGCWTIKTSNGVFTSRFLINANGYFEDKPYTPHFHGKNRFKGDILHLFNMDKHTPVRGRRLVLVGSGASAISAAPDLADLSGSITLLQRTPSYIYEQDNQVGMFTWLAQALYHRGIKLPVSLLNFILQLRSDLVFVVFRKFPWLGKAFFRKHWKDTVDEATYQRDFQPGYGPWEQRIPVAIGLKNLIRNKRINMVTGNIHRFTESAILLDDGRRIDCDLCILATGFNLNFFRFAVTIDGKPVDTRKINFYKGIMMGGIPNYFQPFGAPHTSFTRSVETVSSLITRIIRHMQKEELDTVEISRKDIEQRPRITPHYIMRRIDELPAFYGTLQLPSIDNLFLLRFREKDYLFSKRNINIKTQHRDACTTVHIKSA